MQWLTNRWSKAKGTTIYGFDPVGNLTNINYPASTDVRFTFDALNRPKTMVDAAGTNSYAYNTGGQLWTEDGPFDSDTVTNSYVNGLRTALALQQPTGVWTNGFGYDLAGRLTNVTSQAGSHGYLLGATAAASPLIKRLTLPNTSYITNTYESVARLASTFLRTNDGTVLSKHEYTYNNGGQRTQQIRSDNTYVDYFYDPIGQLTNADCSVATEDRGYFYDSAWNLNRRTNNGTTQVFQEDNKNQLTNALGQQLVYDYNGNVISSGGGHNTYTYDDENQLVAWCYYQVSASQQQNGDLRTEFVYDGKMRLRKRLEYQWYESEPEGPTRGEGQTTLLLPTYWQLVSETRYLYDGNRVIQERDTNNVPTVSYTRGADLSGSLEGAGGIGGLLARSSGYSGGNWTAHNYYHADGNGNITYLVSSSRTLAASYRYDPFGNMISKSGPYSDANTYRFSSKELHSNSGLYYYLYRFYNPNWQRWINRDPRFNKEVLLTASEEVLSFLWNTPLSGPETWYSFCRNAPTHRVDPFALDALGGGIGSLWEEIGCAAGIGKRWKEVYRQDVRSGRTHASSDRWFHCVASCDITRKCGSIGAFIVGWLQELFYGAGPNSEDSRRDRTANYEGINAGCDETKSCEQACEEAGYRR